VNGLREQMVKTVKPTLLVFQVGVLFVLLIACANVANLLLARASHRRRELAIRLALGASRVQAARVFVVECLLLAVGGSLLGCLIATAAVAFVRAMPAGMLPRLSEIRVDAPALGVALALSLTTGAIVGAFVAARVLRSDSSTSLRSEAASPGFTGRPSRALVVVQVAAALVLLAGAGLLLNSFVRLVNRDLGLATANVLTFRLNLPPGRYEQVEQQAAFWRRLVESLGRLPGVGGVAAGTALPFQPTNVAFWPVVIAGRPAESVPLNFSLVAPGYFQALGVPLLKGREFTPADGAGSPAAIVISQSFASRYFGSSDPLGQEVQAANAPPAQVIGVVPNASRSLGLLSSANATDPEVYFSAVRPSNIQRLTSMTIAIRAPGDPMAIVPGLRRALTDLDSGLAIYDMATVRQRLSEALAESRLYSAGAGVFAAVALFLAAIGLYGVMAYSVSSRTQEWGIRMALGANAGGIARHVLGDGITLAATGIVIGIAGAWAANRSLRSLLFGVTPGDPTTLLGVAGLFIVVAGIACYLPARLASRVDPIVALRHE
jgi:putative ABC transport system permease protein